MVAADPGGEGQWILAAGAASLDSFEFGPQHARPRPTLRRKSFREFAPNIRLMSAGINNVDSAGIRLCGRLSFLALGVPMFDPVTTALLRAVLDEVCEEVSGFETGARTHVASRILEAAAKGNITPESLKQVGREALHQAPSMG
ncbi:hypothetical protein ABIB00_003408 [Bradyrhizobium sp. LB14.3]